MEKRVILAIALCVGILFVWTKFVQPPAAPPPTGQAASDSVAHTSPGESGSAPTPAVGQSPPVNPGSAAGAPAAATTYPEELTMLATESQRFVFSNRGASLRHAIMREPKYLRTPADPDSGVDVLRATSVTRGDFGLAFPDSGFATPDDASWRRIEGTPRDEVAYRAEVGGVAIEKHFHLDTTRYRIHLDVTVENRSTGSLDHHLSIGVLGRQDPEAKGGFLSGSTSNTANILCYINEKAERVSVDNVEKESFEKVGAVGWLGADEKFFVAAVVPYPETPIRERKCSGKAVDPHTAEGQLSFAERQLAPGAKTQYSFALFVGPKVISDLEEVRPAGLDVNLTKACDVSLAFISRPMLSLLKIFHGVVGNWGVAIILLTVFIKLLTFYPTQKSLLSAKKMQKLGPKMAAIRKKYENDKQRQSVETMNLYKANGVSPFGGCLPSLIQMPIWIALYSTLNYAVELHRSPFILHIHDLTAKDPYYITPLLMGGVMFVQMKMSPTSPDNQQQAMMAVMMPVMFTAFSLVLPSGLAVYMLTSYLIGIVQQLVVNYLDRRSSGTAAAVSRG